MLFASAAFWLLLSLGRSVAFHALPPMIIKPKFIGSCMAEFDGASPLLLRLDEEGSVLAYLPYFHGLDDRMTIASLEGALAACEATSRPPPEDTSALSGRRQWVADLGMGWAGPRRWRRATWKLSGEHQLEPILAIQAAVESAAATIERTFNEAGVLGEDNKTFPRLQEKYNSVLVNRYLDGKAGIRWHADDERWYWCTPKSSGGGGGGADKGGKEGGDGSDVVIASVSLGAERWFELRRKPRNRPDERRRLRLRLRSGSLLLMAGATQTHWQHSLPADGTCGKVRYNLTYRRVLTPQEDPRLFDIQS